MIKTYINHFLADFKPYKGGRWCYEDGIVLLAAKQLGEALDEPLYFDFVIAYLDQVIGDDGVPNGYKLEEYNIDQIASGKLLEWAYNRTKKEKFNLARQLLRNQLTTHPRTKSGNFFHKARYPHQIWQDGLYMAQPFLAEIVRLEANVVILADILNQFTKVREFLFEPRRDLYVHAYDDTKSMPWANPETGHSPNVWSRACGWQAMALVDVIEQIQPYHDAASKQLASQLRELIDGMLKYQDDRSGMWYQLVEFPELDGNYLETSGSAMLVYAMLKGTRLKVLPERYLLLGQTSYHRMVATMLKVGPDAQWHLNNICEVAGLDATGRDGSISYYLREPRVADEAKGVAPFMMATAEMIYIDTAFLELPFLTNQIVQRKKRKVKIVQFGEGNFLRAFVDNFVQILNDQGKFDGDVALIQPLAGGMVDRIASQDGLYTLYLEGVENNQVVSKRSLIDVCSQFINPYTQYEQFLKLATSPDVKVIFSNTTEAGIALVKEDNDLTRTPDSFPGKLLGFLYTRFKAFNGESQYGLEIVPCELIDYNGAKLKEILLELAHINHLPDAFITWLTEANRFYNTLVDRIVPGYPRAQIDQIRSELGYVDHLVVKGEIFHLWVIEGPSNLKEIFPADAAGLNVLFVDNFYPYKERKVKILNGAHTAIVPIAYLIGPKQVRQAVEHPVIKQFLMKFLFEEVVPTIALPAEQMNAFANSVLERFLNPFIDHQLISIALNSTTKYSTRIMPTLIDFFKKFNTYPPCALFALAALIRFYQGEDEAGEVIPLADDPSLLEVWKKAWAHPELADVVKEVLVTSALFGEAMKAEAIVTTVIKYLTAIKSKGMLKALMEVV